jgi:hypothetical protein
VATAGQKEKKSENVSEHNEQKHEGFAEYRQSLNSKEKLEKRGIKGMIPVKAESKKKNYDDEAEFPEQAPIQEKEMGPMGYKEGVAVPVRDGLYNITENIDGPMRKLTTPIADVIRSAALRILNFWKSVKD